MKVRPRETPGAGPRPTRSFGTHWIVEYVGCDPAALRRVERLRPVMERAVEAARATPLRYAFHQFSPEGVSGIVLIAESHMSFHSWPEDRYLGLDIYTCGKRMDPAAAIELVGRAVGAGETIVRSVERGF